MLDGSENLICLDCVISHYGLVLCNCTAYVSVKTKMKTLGINKEIWEF